MSQSTVNLPCDSNYSEKCKPEPVFFTTNLQLPDKLAQKHNPGSKI